MDLYILDEAVKVLLQGEVKQMQANMLLHLTINDHAVSPERASCYFTPPHVRMQGHVHKIKY